MKLNIQKGQNNQILRQKAVAVKEINAEIKRLVLSMFETVKANNGVGLAAPQVGKSLQIIVLLSTSDVDKDMVLINPQIKKVSKKKDTLEEGCLSFPNVSMLIERPIKITVHALNIDGQLIKIKAKEVLARVIQHEIDHLNGILIIDYSAMRWPKNSRL